MLLLGFVATCVGVVFNWVVRDLYKYIVRVIALVIVLVVIVCDAFVVGVGLALTLVHVLAF